MDNDAGSVSTTVDPRAIISAWYRAIGTGYRALTPEQRVLNGKLAAGPGWALRRAKYGPRGQRERSYKLWREERGLPPVNEV
jgi:hypothetical protein